MPKYQLGEQDSLRAATLELATGSGRTLFGLAVPFRQLAEIRDQRGHYQEQILPGTFADELANRRPKMLFEHGLDVRTGLTPIGKFDQVREESAGVNVTGELFDNELVRPLTDAARAGGMQWSVHFRAPRDGSGETWTKAKGWDIRTVHKAGLPEISLVNFGAYPTILSIRSSLDELIGRSDAEPSGGDERAADEALRKGTLSSEQLSAMQSRHRDMRIRGII